MSRRRLRSERSVCKAFLFSCCGYGMTIAVLLSRRFLLCMLLAGEAISSPPASALIEPSPPTPRAEAVPGASGLGWWRKKSKKRNDLQEPRGGAPPSGKKENDPFR